MFEAVVVVLMFCAGLHFGALADWLVLVAAVSLVVLLISALEASVLGGAPWWSHKVRHRGGTDGKQEESAASGCGDKTRKGHM